MGVMSGHETEGFAPNFVVPKINCDLTPSLNGVFRIAAKAGSAYTATVILLGESGVGKSTIARHIHDSSPRANKPFRIIDLSQSTETLFEDELFGHEKGAFTGAMQSRKSPFEEAEGGTVFLDEIGTLNHSLQAKLLRLVEDKTFRRVGGDKDITVDVRIITATSRDLQKMVESGEFRDDLYYRLNVVSIQIPPLRERREDILPLAEFFLQNASETDHLPRKQLSEDAQHALLSHSWPGNVRALSAEMRRATIMADGDVILPSDLSFQRQKTLTGPAPENNGAIAIFAARPNAVIGQISEIGDMKAIEELYYECMRHLVARSLIENNFSLSRSADALSCGARALSGRVTTYFKANKLDKETIKDLVEKWRETEDRHPKVIFAESLTDLIYGSSIQGNKIEALDKIFKAAQYELVKNALIEYDFVQAYASRKIGWHETTMSKFVMINPDLKAWLEAERAEKSKVHLGLESA